MIFSSNSNTSFLTLHVTAKRRPRRLGLATFFGKIIRLLKVSRHNRGGLALVLYQFFLNFKVHFMKILQRQHLRNLQIMMHSFNIFLQKINVKPSLQKPNSVGALQRITFILILKLSHIIYMKSYQVVSFAGHYVLLVNHMIKQLNLVQDHSLNVHQNNHILTGRGPCNTSKFYLF